MLSITVLERRNLPGHHLVELKGSEHAGQWPAGAFDILDQLSPKGIDNRAYQGEVRGVCLSHLTRRIPKLHHKEVALKMLGDGQFECLYFFAHCRAQCCYIHRGGQHALAHAAQRKARGNDHPKAHRLMHPISQLFYLQVFWPQEPKAAGLGYEQHQIGHRDKGSSECCNQLTLVGIARVQSGQVDEFDIDVQSILARQREKPSRNENVG